MNEAISTGRSFSRRVKCKKSDYAVIRLERPPNGDVRAFVEFNAATCRGVIIEVIPESEVDSTK